MVVSNAKNRELIKNYLEQLSEDDFIDKIITPVFYKNGYNLYRKNIHGPGEHGKDVIYYRHVPLFYDLEYIAVQAKAEKVTTSNVAKFAQQILRARNVPFPGKSGGERMANYAIFINSQEHTNDADKEFPPLTKGETNVKILAQENVIDLIISSDFVPDELKGQLEENVQTQNNSFEDEIRNILFSGDLDKIDFLFTTRLKIETRPLSSELKGMIINFVFHQWEKSSGFYGRVRPIKWLNAHFDFIQLSQYPRLFKVIEEYASSYPSFDAYDDTSEIVKKTTIEQIKTFEKQFIELSANRAFDFSIKNFPLLTQKNREYLTASDFIDTTNFQVCESIVLIGDALEVFKKTKDTPEYDLTATKEKVSKAKKDLMVYLNVSEDEN